MAGSGGWARDSERAVDVVQGSFLLIRRELSGGARQLRRELRDYGEKADLCAARRRGSADDPRCNHRAGASSRLRSDKAILVLPAKVTLARRHLPRGQQPFASHCSAPGRSAAALAAGRSGW